MRAKILVDSNDFSGRIDLEVPEEVLSYLQRISDRTGQSISEISAALVIEGAERLDPEHSHLQEEY